MCDPIPSLIYFPVLDLAAMLIGSAKPAQGRPIVKPRLNCRGAMLWMERPLANCHCGRSAKRLAVSKRRKEEKLRAFEPPVVDRVVFLRPMHGQVNWLAPEPHGFSFARVMPPFRHGVTDDAQSFFVLANRDDEIIYRVMEIQQLKVWLEMKAQSGWGAAFYIFRLKNGFRFSVEGLYMRPFQACHIQREILPRA